jgi:hypothetical protein
MDRDDKNKQRIKMECHLHSVRVRLRVGKM